VHQRPLGELIGLEDPIAAVTDAGLPTDDPQAVERGRGKVAAEWQSAERNVVRVTPTFFIDGRRYDGPWDETTLAEAMLGTPGHRVHSAALDFARWAPATGSLLLLATVLAISCANLPGGAAFAAFSDRPLGLAFGDSGFRMTLLHCIDDALLTVFFLVVGLEIKREMTVGRLANRRSAAFPVAAALGGMAVPALVYSLAIPDGSWERGWGIPMATDTAFAVALIVMLGERVPVALRLFLTAQPSSTIWSPSRLSPSSTREPSSGAICSRRLTSSLRSSG
jgi:Na+:H+ antiporter, NhaA family